VTEIIWNEEEFPGTSHAIVPHLSVLTEPEEPCCAEKMMRRMLLMWWELSLIHLYLLYHLHPLRVPLLQRENRKQALHLSDRLLSHLQDIGMLSLTSSHLLQRLEHLLLPPFPLLSHQPLSLHRLSYVAIVPLFESPALSLSLSLVSLVVLLAATRAMLPLQTSGMQWTTCMVISSLRRSNPTRRLALAALSPRHLSRCHLLALRTTENQHQLFPVKRRRRMTMSPAMLVPQQDLTRMKKRTMTLMSSNSFSLVNTRLHV
jgi:hypothetical protein